MVLDLPTGIQLAVVIFSAGAAYGTIKLVGSKVDSLSQLLQNELRHIDRRLTILESIVIYRERVPKKEIENE